MLPYPITGPISHPLRRPEILEAHQITSTQLTFLIPLLFKNDCSFWTDILMHKLRAVNIQNRTCELFGQVIAAVEGITGVGFEEEKAKRFRCGEGGGDAEEEFEDRKLLVFKFSLRALWPWLIERI
jgi:hypothetical protein